MKRNLYINDIIFTEKIFSPLQLDPGTILATDTNIAPGERFRVIIRVAGEVKIKWKGKIYTRPSLFPKALFNAIRNHYRNIDVPGLEIIKKNWFEVVSDKNNAPFSSYPVEDIEDIALNYGRGGLTYGIIQELLDAAGDEIMQESIEQITKISRAVSDLEKDIEKIRENVTEKELDGRTPDESIIETTVEYTKGKHHIYFFVKYAVTEDENDGENSHFETLKRMYFIDGIDAEYHRDAIRLINKVMDF